jgi:subfamily B ATP-binding cassette protein HlyB/CyaB
MAGSARAPGEQLRAFEPFDRLSAEAAAALEPLLEPRRYRMGQTLLRPDALPEGVLLVLRGHLRSLGPHPSGQGLRTIARLEPPSVVGWVGLLRREPCEHLRASRDVEGLLLPAAAFRDLLAGHPSLVEWFEQQLPAEELHTLLTALVSHEPQWLPLLEQWPAVLPAARAISVTPGPDPELALPPGFRWYASSGERLAQPWIERPLEPLAADAPWLRLVGLPDPAAADSFWAAPAEPRAAIPDSPLDLGGNLEPPLDGRFPGEYSLSPEPPPPRAEGRGGSLVLSRASGPRDIPIAVCHCLADYFGVPINRDALRDQVESLLQRQPQLSLINLGQILDSLGLQVMLSRVPADRLHRVPTPALLMQNGHIGVLDGVDIDGQARLLEAELGPLRVPSADLATLEGGLVELLLFERKSDAKEQTFNWSWYAPFLKKHQRALIEVLVASAAINVLMLATPLGFRLLLDTATQANIGSLVSIAAVMLLAALAVGLIKTVRTYIFTETANRIDQESKSIILDQLVRLPQGFFDSRPVGQVTFYFTQLDRLREFLVGQSLPLLIDTAFSFIYFAILLTISPLLTLVVVSTVPLMVALTIASNPIVYAQIKRSMAESMRTHSFLTESITGIQTIKSQNAELKTRWEFQNRYARYLGEDFKLRISRETIANLGQFIQQLNGILVIAVGIWLVMEQRITIGDIIAFRILDGYITGPLVKLAGTWQQFQMSRQQMSMVADVVDRTPEQSVDEALNIPMPPLQGRVQFVDVSFRFSGDGPMVLQNVNLEVPVGSFVGLVGGSGSGKSTLLKLLPRFYRPLEGKVLIDGLDINKLELYSLRRQIGVVPQDSLLFDGTVRDNLLMVKPDATSDEMIRAARIACAHDFIMEMPKGYNSSVGERGAGLSGGQRQRLALARAVLQNPRMLILDEATSALDARTERQVCINLFEAFRGRTVFFITHRLSTVKPADFIVLMDRGAVMEVGSHKQLVGQQGWYYALYQSQNQEGVT